MSDMKTPPEYETSSRLGTFRKDFRVVNHKIKRDLRMGFGILLILLALLAFVAGCLLSWQAVQRHGRAILLDTLPIPALLFIVGLLSGSLLLFFTRRHWQDRVSLYENGFVIQQGKATKPLLWENTACFTAKITVLKFGTGAIGERIRLLFTDEQGEKLTLSSRYVEMLDLVQQIRNALLPCLYDKALARMRQGDTIKLAPELGAVLKGVMIKDDLCRWMTLNPPQISKGILRLQRHGDNKLLYRIPIKKVSNLDLLLTLFENPPLG